MHDGLLMLLQEPPESDGKVDSGSDSGDEHEVLFTPSRQQQDAPGKDAPGEMLSAKRQRAALQRPRAVRYRVVARQPAGCECYLPLF